MFSFTKNAWKEYVEWQDEDRKTLKKINKLMQSIERDGAMEGEGQPEKLKALPNTYSRHIDEKNRLIYIAVAENYTLTACKGHYDE
ncbi:MAG: Txe/YoeB family addiction module toxin [Selenomonadaceae bacterium]|nr:Txe/YoeB family addiction module toxin [Selenomonadaceae bacterium]